MLRRDPENWDPTLKGKHTSMIPRTHVPLCAPRCQHQSRVSFRSLLYPSTDSRHAPRRLHRRKQLARQYLKWTQVAWFTCPVSYDETNLRSVTACFPSVPTCQLPGSRSAAIIVLPYRGRMPSERHGRSDNPPGRDGSALDLVRTIASPKTAISSWINTHRISRGRAQQSVSLHSPGPWISIAVSCFLPQTLAMQK